MTDCLIACMIKKILLDRRYDEPLSIYSRFKVRWNDHLVNKFPLMFCYGINTSILHLTFFSSRILIISYKMLNITGIANEKTNELTIYGIYVERHNILPTRTTFFISSAGKIKSVQDFKIKLF